METRAGSSIPGLSKSALEILQQVATGGAYWGLSRGRVSGIAQGLAEARLCRVIGLENGSWVAIPLNAEWDFKNYEIRGKTP